MFDGLDFVGRTLVGDYDGFRDSHGFSPSVTSYNHLLVPYNSMARPVQGTGLPSGRQVPCWPEWPTNTETMNLMNYDLAKPISPKQVMQNTGGLGAATLVKSICSTPLYTYMS